MLGLHRKNLSLPIIPLIGFRSWNSVFLGDKSETMVSLRNRVSPIYLFWDQRVWGTPVIQGIQWRELLSNLIRMTKSRGRLPNRWILESKQNSLMESWKSMLIFIKKSATISLITAIQCRRQPVWNICKSVTWVKPVLGVLILQVKSNTLSLPIFGWFWTVLSLTIKRLT